MASVHELPLETPVLPLPCSEAFDALSPKEKRYTHHLSRSSWWGSLIILCQTSPEAADIFCLLTKVFRTQSLDSLQQIVIEKGILTDEEFKLLLVYYCGLAYNCSRNLPATTTSNDIMKTIIFLAIAALASAAPQFGNDQFERDFIRIISDTRSEPVDGSYRFDFEAENGIVRSESGSPGLNGGIAQQGSWRVVYPDGSEGQFSFVADDQGARFESPLLPVGPEMPQHALDQIAFAEEEKRQGIFHDGQWDEATYGAANF